MSEQESSPIEDPEYYVPRRDVPRRAVAPPRPMPNLPAPATPAGIVGAMPDLGRDVHVHVHMAQPVQPGQENRRQGVDNAPWWMGGRGTFLFLLAVALAAGAWAYLHFVLEFI